MVNGFLFRVVSSLQYHGDSFCCTILMQLEINVMVAMILQQHFVMSKTAVHLSWQSVAVTIIL